MIPVAIVSRDPTDKDILTRWIQLRLVMESVPPDSARSQSFVTLDVCALHRYTQGPRPTPSTFVDDQSTRLR